jgi:predicted Zn finger-like uncharacterized protein
MPIATTCPSCNQRLQVNDQHAGKAVRCPKCQQVFQVPKEAPPVRPARPAPTNSRPRRTSSALVWMIGLGCGLSLLIFVGVSIVTLWLLFDRSSVNSTAVQQRSAPTEPSVKKNAGIPGKDDAGVPKLNKESAPKVIGAVQSDQKPLFDAKADVIRVQLENSEYRVESSLGADDFADPVRNARCKVYEIQLPQNSKYAFECSSDDFLVWLIVDILPLAKNDVPFPMGEDFDKGNDHKARVVTATSKQGVYRATVTSVGKGEGAFTLTIRKEASPSPADRKGGDPTPPKSSGSKK